MLKCSRVALVAALTLALCQVALGQVSGTYFVNSGGFQVFTGVTPEPIDAILIAGPMPTTPIIAWGPGAPGDGNFWDAEYSAGEQTYINTGGVMAGLGSPPAGCSPCDEEVTGAFDVAEYALGLTSADFGDLTYGGWADGTIRTTSVGLTLAGDYDGDGFVGGLDLDLVLQNWGNPSTPVPAGWVNHFPSGTISAGELDEVLNYWGDDISNFPSAAARAVPEPASLSLIGLLCFAGFLRRK